MVGVAVGVYGPLEVQLQVPDDCEVTVHLHLAGTTVSDSKEVTSRAHGGGGGARARGAAPFSPFRGPGR